MDPQTWTEKGSFLVRRAVTNCLETRDRIHLGDGLFANELANELSDVWACCLQTGFILTFGTVTNKSLLVSYLWDSQLRQDYRFLWEAPQVHFVITSRLAPLTDLWKFVGT